MTKTRTNRDTPPHADSGRRMHLTRLALVVLVFGLLLWARFLLVTGHPRTALAQPAHAAAAEP